MQMIGGCICKRSKGVSPNELGRRVSLPIHDTPMLTPDFLKQIIIEPEILCKKSRGTAGLSPCLAI